MPLTTRWWRERTSASPPSGAAYGEASGGIGAERSPTWS